MGRERSSDLWIFLANYFHGQRREDVTLTFREVDAR